jgi:glycosyltransferase involved in cell wall biosynthesis
MKLSILMPVYNEINMLLGIVEKVKAVNIDKELIAVDDCSNDGTRELIKKNFAADSESIKIIYHQKNMGKGAAIKTALSYASGDYTIIQDADLEYDPQDYIPLFEAVQKDNLAVVYGSRFLATWRSTSLAHFLVNKFFTALTNILFGCRLSDMETCYKLIRTDIFKSLDITSKRFEIEAEITAKLLKKGYNIREVPISYHGRSYHEGKKITAKDGLITLAALFKYRFNR